MLSGRIKYDFQKSRFTGPWDHRDSVSAKKVFKKISCLCTFKQETEIISKKLDFFQNSPKGGYA
jgi:hypothetical protein